MDVEGAAKDKTSISFCTVETLAFHNSLISGVSTINLDRLWLSKKSSDYSTQLFAFTSLITSVLEHIFFPDR